MLRIMAMGAPGQIEASIVQITKIVDCIIARDKARAERAVRTYVSAAGASALRQLAADEEA
jgi:DNA-binding GntR family transcriptional regulator